MLQKRIDGILETVNEVDPTRISQLHTHNKNPSIYFPINEDFSKVFVARSFPRSRVEISIRCGHVAQKRVNISQNISLLK